MPSGWALPAMVTSSTHHGVSSALTRISTSRLPKPLCRDRLGDLVAGQRLGVGRDRILEVEDDAVGGQIARLFQRPRIRSRHEQQAAARTDHGRVPSRSDLNPTPISSRPVARKPCSCRRPMVRQGPWHRFPQHLLDGYRTFTHAAAADRTNPLPRTVRARPVAGGDGDRLLRFPRLAGSDLRRRPRRIVRGAQRRQSGAGLSARRRRARRLGGAGICGQVLR